MHVQTYLQTYRAYWTAAGFMTSAVWDFNTIKYALIVENTSYSRPFPLPPLPPPSLSHLWKLLRSIALTLTWEDPLMTQQSFLIILLLFRVCQSRVKESMLQKHALCHNPHIFESVMVSGCSNWKYQGSVILGSSSFGDTMEFQG